MHAVTHACRLRAECQSNTIGGIGERTSRKLDSVQSPEGLDAAFTEDMVAARALLAKGVPEAQVYARMTAHGFAE